MSKRFIRDSFFGQFVYHLSGRRVLTYPEEDPSYVVPEKYYLNDSVSVSSNSLSGVPTAISRDDQGNSKDKADSAPANGSEKAPLGEVDTKFIATWDGPNDPENPYNWTNREKYIFCFLIGYLTFCQYSSAAIYTAMAAEIKEEFDLTYPQATLPLSLFVVGYGIGPMILSPLSEMAKVGRNYIYVGSLIASFVLGFPLAFADNFAVICVFRFLSGLFCPAMAVGGASYSDLLSNHLYIGQAIWGFFSWASIGCAPFIGSVLVVKCGWQWVFKFLLILHGANMLILGFVLPETYSHTLLTRKAYRLRAKTGNDKITSHGLIEHYRTSIGNFLFESLVRPFEVSMVEPVVILINVYISLIYIVVYLWFEAFPIVFIELRGWKVIPMGMAFFSVAIGASIGSTYFSLVTRYLQRSRKAAGTPIFAELFIHPSMGFFGALFMPLGIFLFGWTSTKSVHWIVSLIGGTCFGFSAYMGFQTQLSYLAHAFPRYVASVMGANDFFRSITGGLVCLAAHPLYYNLHAKSPNYPVGWGSTVLGFLAMVLAFVPLFFHFYGPQLRASSKYAN